MLSAPAQTLSRTIEEQLGCRTPVRVVSRMNKGTRQPILPPRPQLWQLPLCSYKGTVIAGYRDLG